MIGGKYISISFKGSIVKKIALRKRKKEFFRLI